MQAGIDAALERGWTGSGIDSVLRTAGVPKGSFYHYFSCKDEFGYAVLESYQDFVLRRLHRCFGSTHLGLSAQLDAFLGESLEGMARHGWRRGCLVGALGQELGGFHEGFRERLLASLSAWEAVLTDALARAQQRGEAVADLDPGLAARAFWSAWEGAMLRARLARDGAPLEAVVADFQRRIAVHSP